jgi:UDP-glucose 4-epimerase
MKICVVGGAGFLGSHVADQLTLAGHEVTIFDAVPSRWANSNQTVVQGDIMNFEEIAAMVHGNEVVYNFAAIADLDEASGKPIQTAMINIVGNANVLEACRRFSVKRFVFASTVYVNSREGGFYRCSKQAAENYIEEYGRLYGLSHTILRFGSLYGTRASNKNGLWRIIEQGLKTGKISYTGSADTLREYIHVEDAARASVEILHGKYCNKRIVLTGHEQIRIVDILETIAEMLGLQDSVEILPGEQTGHYVRTPYAYQPKMALKYSPDLHVDLGQGLLQLIHDIETCLNDTSD